LQQPGLSKLLAFEKFARCTAEAISNWQCHLGEGYPQRPELEKQTTFYK